jgi:DNA-directed RNA polymerase subunit L
MWYNPGCQRRQAIKGFRRRYQNGDTRRSHMPVRLLANDGKELKLRIEGEGSSTLQMFRSRLNDHPDVEYANFFTGHPDLDDPELYLRVKDGKDASKLITELCNTIVKDFASLKI